MVVWFTCTLDGRRIACETLAATKLMFALLTNDEAARLEHGKGDSFTKILRNPCINGAISNPDEYAEHLGKIHGL